MATLQAAASCSNVSQLTCSGVPSSSSRSSSSSVVSWLSPSSKFSTELRLSCVSSLSQSTGVLQNSWVVSQFRREAVRPGKVGAARAASGEKNVLIINTNSGGHAVIGFFFAKDLRAAGFAVTILTVGEESSDKMKKPPFSRFSPHGNRVQFRMHRYKCAVARPAKVEDGIEVARDDIKEQGIESAQNDKEEQGDNDEEEVDYPLWMEEDDPTWPEGEDEGYGFQVSQFSERWARISRSSFPRPLYFLKLKPNKRARQSSDSLSVSLSCDCGGRVLLRTHNGSSCYPDGRLGLSRNYNSNRMSPVSTRASSVLANENRPASTSDTGVGTDADDQCRELKEDSSPLVQEADKKKENAEEKEKLRRQRIGLANKGKVPWNKGRQHTPETIERIKQRTYQAMHSPKVKAKLKLNPRHPQSDATRLKIKKKLREQWDLKRRIRGYQEACLKDWKESVAEAARVGAPGDEEYEWDSYSKIRRRLREESKSGGHSETKGGTRQRRERSEEHRLKIAAAIRAKWEDPEYQQKVREGMIKTGNVSQQNIKRKTKNTPAPATTVATRPVGKKINSEVVVDQSFIDAVMLDEKPSRTWNSESEVLSRKETSPPLPNGKSVIKKVNLLERVTQKSELGKVEEPTGRKGSPVSLNSSPHFVDPKAQEKLQKLKILQANRAIMEQKRKESAYNARLLMAEAEKAARALEAAAAKDEFAMASLSETRRLMAEAARLIQTAESGRNRLTSSNQPSK